MKTDDLDFVLPPELIAQHPPAVRSASRLLHYVRATGRLDHRRFSDLPSLLRAGDVLVFNNARVLPARFALRKDTGGRLEGLFLHELSPGTWRVLLRDAGKLPLQTSIAFAEDAALRLTLLNRNDGGEYDVAVSSEAPAHDVLGRVGRMPLPPYIRRDRTADAADDADRERYQTVYAQAPGSVAAPTAGLHFDDAVLRSLDAMGITRVMVTLHVGMGTFKPVMADELSQHAMHTERWEIDTTTAEMLNETSRQQRRIVAVGTTSARVLESHARATPWQAGTGETSIFIYPPYTWNYVGALLTNFHLPRSTLVGLVAGFVGLDEQRRIYAEAIANSYRFFSYGDAMFLE